MITMDAKLLLMFALVFCCLMKFFQHINILWLIITFIVYGISLCTFSKYDEIRENITNLDSIRETC